MTTEHFIAGKDASLESTISTMKGRLSALGIEIEECSWLNPVPDIWSVHIRNRDCPAMFTNGKGATRLAALASALGEYFERLSTNYFWTHYYLGADVVDDDFAHYPQEKWFPIADPADWPEELLTAELQAFYNPDDNIPATALVDFNTGDIERGICAIPYVCQRDGSTVYFPVNVIGNLYVSNGMSAGNTPAEARAQALAEIFERHVKFRVIAEGLCLPEVPAAVIARFPRIEADIRALRAAGFGILVKDASLSGEYPVMNVTLLHPQDQGCFSSFGAHPRFEIALERALTELLQGRALDALAGFPEPGFDLEEVASAPNLEIHFVDSSGIISWDFLGDEPDYDFCDWNFSDNTADDYQWQLDRLHADGYDVYVADFTHLDVYTCRIIVPGVSEIYPLDDLEWENNSVSNALREPILELSNLDNAECGELLEALNELNVADLRPVAALVGLMADADSLWATLRVGELKTLLALAIGDEEAVREGCTWIHQLGQVTPERSKVYRCIETLLKLGEMIDEENDDGDDEIEAELDLSPYRRALLNLYGEATLHTAEALINGTQRFFGLEAPGVNLDGCQAHQALLAAYAKVQRKKRETTT